MKIRTLARQSIARTLKRIAHAPDRQALMERGLRASYFGALLAQEKAARNRRRRQQRRDARFYGGMHWNRRQLLVLWPRLPGKATALKFNRLPIWVGVDFGKPFP